MMKDHYVDCFREVELSVLIDKWKARDALRLILKALTSKLQQLHCKTFLAAQSLLSKPKLLVQIISLLEWAGLEITKVKMFRSLTSLSMVFGNGRSRKTFQRNPCKKTKPVPS
jgi:hypothetical protein